MQILAQSLLRAPCKNKVLELGVDKSKSSPLLESAGVAVQRVDFSDELDDPRVPIRPIKTNSIDGPCSV